MLIIGVLGALILRGLMIFAGSLLLTKFHWLLYVFGVFLLLTGMKMWFSAGKEPELETNPILRWMRNHLRLSPDYAGNSLSVVRDGKRWFTPFFVVLILIAVIDVIFAVDSIPAIFAITTDPFICAHLQRVRSAGPACHVLPIGRDGRSLPPVTVRASSHPDLYRHQDGHHRPV